MTNDTKKTKRKLFEKLKEFYPDKDFVGGVLSNTEHDVTDRRLLSISTKEMMFRWKISFFYHCI